MYVKALSGLLYLIYTLDYPLIHNYRKLTIQEYDQSKLPKTTTFIDDSICKIRLDKKLNNHNNQIKTVLDKITVYMNANALVLNPDKSRIISPKLETKDNISINIHNQTKPIKPVSSIVYLGIHIQDNLRWNQFIKDGPNNLIKRLRQKINAIQLI